MLRARFSAWRHHLPVDLPGCKPDGPALSPPGEVIWGGVQAGAMCAPLSAIAGDERLAQRALRLAQARTRQDASSRSSRGAASVIVLAATAPATSAGLRTSFHRPLVPL